MHGGNGVSNQTTGSYIGELGDKCSYYITGSSTPCISFFKPFWFDCSGVFFEESQRLQAIDYWLKHEKIHRLILENRVDFKEYQNGILSLEQELDKELKTLSIYSAHINELQRLSKCYFEKDLDLVEKLLSDAKETGSIKGSFAFKNFWNRMNERLKYEVY